MKKAKWLFFTFAAYQLIAPSRVHAYIDPGSGSIFVELVIAVALAGLFALKLNLHRLKEFFFGKKDGNNKQQK